MLSTAKDWQAVVAHHSGLLKQQYSSVWLGGYSTGANLVTTQALKDPDVAGLLLFSPAFQPRSVAVKYAKLASYFVTWADQDPEDNYLRYNSLPMSGAATYYKTSQIVRAKLEHAQYAKPVFAMMSESDSLIDTNYVMQQFTRVMTNPHSRLILQGESQPTDQRAIHLSMKLSRLRISNGSHMGLLFSPTNPSYGIHGSEIIYNNGQSYRYSSPGKIWFSAFGYQEPGKYHARLTYNPYFKQSMKVLDNVMQSTS